MLSVSYIVDELFLDYLGVIDYINSYLNVVIKKEVFILFLQRG